MTKRGMGPHFADLEVVPPWALMLLFLEIAFLLGSILLRDAPGTFEGSSC